VLVRPAVDQRDRRVGWHRLFGGHTVLGFACIHVYLSIFLSIYLFIYLYIYICIYRYI
jgi:hypothetical protein